MSWSIPGKLKKFFGLVGQDVARKSRQPPIILSKETVAATAKIDEQLYNDKIAALLELVAHPDFQEIAMHSGSRDKKWTMREEMVVTQDNGWPIRTPEPYIALGFAFYSVETNAQGDALPTQTTTRISDIGVVWDAKEKRYALKRVERTVREENRNGIAGDLKARAVEAIRRDLAGEDIALSHAEGSTFVSETHFKDVGPLLTAMEYLRGKYNTREEMRMDSALQALSSNMTALRRAARTGEDLSYIKISGACVAYTPWELRFPERAARSGVAQAFKAAM